MTFTRHTQGSFPITLSDLERKGNIQASRGLSATVERFVLNTALFTVKLLLILLLLQ